MKEVLRTQPIIQTETFRTGPEGLTMQAQRGYSMSKGDIFMAEPGQGEFKDGNKHQKPSSSPKIVSAVPDASKTKRGHLPEEIARISQMGKVLEELGGASEVQGQISRAAHLPQEQAARVPEQEAVRKARSENPGGHKAEYTGVVGYNKLGTIDTSTIIDPAFKALMEEELKTIRGLEQLGLNSSQQIMRARQAIAGRYVDLSDADKIWAAGVVKQFNEELGDLNKQQAHLNEQQARSEPRRRGSEPENYFDQKELDDIADDPAVREEIFNKFFNGVDASPGQEFSTVFNSLYDQPVVSAFIKHLQNKNKYALANKYAEEFKMRQVSHNANYAVLENIGTEELAKFIHGFTDEQADIAFSKRGVTAAMHFYEQALLKIKAENNGYIPASEVRGDPELLQLPRVEVLAKEYMIAAIKKGLILDRDLQTGEPKTTAVEEMKEWEINRALSFARGLGIITGRTIEIAAMSKLPKNLYVTLYAQNVIRDIALFRHSVGKFNIGLVKNLVFGYVMNGKKARWDYKELEDLRGIQKNNKDLMLDIINGISADDKDRFISVLNPLKIGGVMSISTWRYEDDDFTASALKDIKEEGKNWIGTGVLIEKRRGKLKTSEALRNIKNPQERKKAREDSEKAKLEIGEILTKKVAEIQPLRLFYNFENLQKGVLSELGKNVGGPEGEYISDDGEKGITMKNSFLQADLDELAVLQEDAIINRREELGFNGVKNEVQKERLKRLTKLIREKFLDEKVYDNKTKTEKDIFIENLRDKGWKMPFNFGLDDVPFDQYKFGALGGNGIARRWNDIGAAAVASKAVMKLMDNMDSFKSMDQIVPILREVYQAVSQYDPTTAQEVVRKLAKGVIRFYGKNYMARMPLGIGTIYGIFKKTSFAEVAFGKGAMAWNEIEVNEFTRQIRDNGLDTVEGQHELQGEVGGDKKALLAAYTRFFGPLALLAVSYFILSKSLEREK